MELKNFVMTICAPRGSGKTYFVRHLLRYKFDDFDNIIIMCPSTEFNDDYRDFKPRDGYFELDERIQTYHDLSKDDLDELFSEQADTKRRALAQARFPEQYREKFTVPSTLLILDDCIDSGLLNYKGTVDKIAERGRHINISVLSCNQRLSSVSRSVRLNSDFFIIFRPFSISEIEQFLEQFVSRKYKKAMWSKLDEIFKMDHEFIILDNRNKDASVPSKLFHSNTHDFLKGKMTPIKFEE